MLSLAVWVLQSRQPPEHKKHVINKVVIIKFGESLVTTIHFYPLRNVFENKDWSSLLDKWCNDASLKKFESFGKLSFKRIGGLWKAIELEKSFKNGWLDLKMFWKGNGFEIELWPHLILKVAYVSHLARIRSIVARARLEIGILRALKCFEDIFESFEKECLSLEKCVKIGLEKFLRGFWD